MPVSPVVWLGVFLGALSLLTPTSALAESWNPGPGQLQIPIWPRDAPDNSTTPAVLESVEDVQHPLLGKIRSISNVSRPTMTVYSPLGRTTRTAVVVFPGGGYRGLAIDLEGTEVCDWLTRKGITCIVLKYRVPDSGCHWDPTLKRHVVPKVFRALQDAQRAIGLVRSRAAEWNIDPKKVGVIGFSAGGNLVAAISTNYKKRSYSQVDAADQESCRPDFAIALYPGHMSVNHDDLSKLSPGFPVTGDTPPTFLVHATDDPVDPVEYSLLYYSALKKAKVPVEMHLYAKGGHAFALRNTELPVKRWTELAEDWLRGMGILPRAETRPAQQ